MGVPLCGQDGGGWRGEGAVVLFGVFVVCSDFPPERFQEIHTEIFHTVNSTDTHSQGEGVKVRRDLCHQSGQDDLVWNNTSFRPHLGPVSIAYFTSTERDPGLRETPVSPSRVL